MRSCVDDLGSLLSVSPYELIERFKLSQLRDHDAMSALCAWFVRHVAIRPSNIGLGIPDGLIDHHAEVATRPLAAILDDLVSLRACVLCGGMALLVQQAAVAIGYSAFCLNLGDPDSHLTHVVVLVEYVGRGAKTCALYDPFFGYFIADDRGRPADLWAIVAAVRSRRDELRRLHLKRLGPRYKAVIATPAYLDQIDSLAPQRLRARPPFQGVDAGDTKLLAWDADLRAYGATFARSVLDWLKTRMTNPSVFDLLRMPLGTSGEAAAMDIMDRLRSTLSPIPK